MKATAVRETPEYAEIALYTIVFLFFLQLISDFVEAIYAFGLLGTSIPPELATVVVLFTPILLLLFPRGLSKKPLLFAAWLMFASRLVETMLSTRGRMIVSGIGVGSFMLFFPALLWHLSRGNRAAAASRLGAGLTLAVSLSMLFRASHYGTDISTVGMFQLIGWLLALAAAILVTRIDLPAAPISNSTRKLEVGEAGPGRLFFLVLGLMSALILLYFVFAAPNVIARWTGGSYLLIEIMLVLALTTAVWLCSDHQRLGRLLQSSLFLAANLIFLLAVFLTIWTQQVDFPAASSAYPIPEPAVSIAGQLSLYTMLILFPLIPLNFTLFTHALVESRPLQRSLAGSFLLGALFLLLAIFANVFTTVYDYIPVVGPFFRDKFWFVHLVLGVMMLLPLWSLRKRAGTPPRAWNPRLTGLVAVAGLASIAAAFFTGARPAEQAGSAQTVRLLTYNIQQGYSEDGEKNFTGQLKLIRQEAPDIIGLQESDTNRIAGGSSDVVRYMADSLDMYAYYGPKVVPGTFGIALLSKYPIDNPRTYYMYSEGEQTAAIEAEITIDDRTFLVVVTHLGNGGPIIQQQNILAELRGKQNVILMGDFNFRPDGPQYRLTTGVFEDAWLLRWPEGTDDQGVSVDNRIDHIFVSPGTNVTNARYLISPESDHPAMTAEIGW